MEEKPLPCSSCKRKTEITYKELSEDKCVTYKMCSQCPILQQKLGNPIESQGVTCSQCQTSFHSFVMGEGFGCAQCYQIFEDHLIKELSNLKAIPMETTSSLAKTKKMSLHFGKGPDLFENKEFKNKLESLHVALTEALALENYERAATLRDQIKSLMGEQDG